ncbi:MAG: hypothetical protein ACK47B_22300 [Armatimonadota bacterium]
MNSWKASALAALGVTGLVAGAVARQPVAAVAQSAPSWLSDFEAARAQARQSGKPIFLVFR